MSMDDPSEAPIAHDDAADDAPSERAIGSQDWKKALDKVVPCVVVLKVTQTRCFDTEAAGSSYATGFVVDKHRGIILTNRHVVTPGPIVAEAVFLNREEVPVHPLYYDPVHDFGFMRFDPDRLQYMELGEVPLAPHAAAVGLDIRVVGNDSGEKISILSGTLARLDRDAPHYSRKGFNDFNTFYLQAASGTKGGSSGSPVIDVQGRAVGLNAGGKNKAASAYYLPLHRVVRALSLLQGRLDVAGGEAWTFCSIPRGDLQTTFVFKGFDEVRRLGLRQETEAAVRAAQQGAIVGGGEGSGPDVGETGETGTGMLVVDTVVPGGPADGVLEPGDVLVRMGGAIITHFLPLEDLLDSAVGGEVQVEVERGGTTLRASIRVQDLHAVTPDSFLELGGGSLHQLSYQQARNNRAATGQVYVSDPGYLLGKAGAPRHAIITALAGQATPTLDQFLAAIKGLTHGQRVPLEYFTFGERNRRRSVILHCDWNWYGPPVRWERRDAQGIWEGTVEWPRSMTSGSALPSSPRLQPSRPPQPPGRPPPLPSPAPDGAVPTLPSIPRMHSVPDVPSTHPLEKTQGGVSALHDDARLAAGGVPMHGAHAEGGSGRGEEREGGGSNGGLGRGGWPEHELRHFEERMRCGLVMVDVEIPLVALIDGVHSRSFSGCGAIVHQSEGLGLVLVDRNTVVVGPGDVLISFGAFPAEVPGRVRFLHPLHNFSLVSYDPRELPPEARCLVQPLDLRPFPPLRRGDSPELVCLNSTLSILRRTSQVTNPTMSVNLAAAEVPRFRALHEEVIRLDQDFGVSYAGVLADREGGVRALWGSYSEQVDKHESEWTAGLPASVFAPWVDAVRRRLTGGTHGPGATVAPPAVHVLGAELEPLLLSKATQFGLPGEWVQRLVRLDPERRQVMRVRSCTADSHAQQVLRGGDMVLCVAGCPVSSFVDVEQLITGYTPSSSATGSPAAHIHAASLPEAKRRRKEEQNGGTADVAGVGASDVLHSGQGGGEGGGGQAPPEIPLTIFRAGQVLEVGVGLGTEDGLGTSRLVHWCGAQLQAPHRGVREHGFLPPCHGVYISRWHHGSPAHRYGLFALHWITEVNGEPTPDLDTFLELVRGLEDGADVRVRLVHFQTTRSKVLSLKVDYRYWPTWELRLDPATAQWTRHTLL